MPPKRIQRFIRQSSKADDALTPLFLGALTVFIPCGVTQAMQLLALGSGSATQGALIMFAFVLGTSPIFYLLGLATARLSSAWEGTFMQAAAIAIIFMALYSMLSGSRLLGYQIGLGNPIEMADSGGHSSDSSDSNIEATPIPILDDGAAQMTGIAGSDLPAINADGYQEIKIAALNSGYEPTSLRLRAGVPARLSLVTKALSISSSCQSTAVSLRRSPGIRAVTIGLFLAPTAAKSPSFLIVMASQTSG